jgi:hypothetical protein
MNIFCDCLYESPLQITMDIPDATNEIGADWLLNTEFYPHSPAPKPARGFWDVVMNDPPRRQIVFPRQRTNSSRLLPSMVVGGVSADDQGHPHVCHIAGCSKRFKEAKKVRMHIRAIHKAEFRCDICGRLLSSKKALRRHKARKIPCRPPLR